MIYVTSVFDYYKQPILRFKNNVAIIKRAGSKNRTINKEAREKTNSRTTTHNNESLVKDNQAVTLKDVKLPK